MKAKKDRFAKILITAILLANATSVLEAGQTHAPYEIVKLGNVIGVIFPKEAAIPVGEEVKGYWTPTRADVIKADSCIKRFLEKYDVSKQTNFYGAVHMQDDINKILRDLSKYKRQYVGIVVNSGKRIHINLFYSSERSAGDKEFADWRSNYVLVEDGGRHFFRIEYDLKHDACSKLSINGEA